MENKAKASYALSETDEFGVELKFESEFFLDEFEDYLAEHTYTFFDLREIDGVRSIMFGQASSIEKVENILARFLDR